MIEVFAEIISVVFGRFLFETIGAASRFGWARLTGSRITWKEIVDEKEIDAPIDSQATWNRVVGFVVLLGLLLLALALF